MSSLDDLVLLIRKRINLGDIESALRMILSAVELILTEPLCNAQVFGSKVLDDLLIEIGENNRKFLPLDKSENFEFDNKKVYLVSSLRKAGGHSRLLAEYVLAQPAREHIIISTEFNEKSDFGGFKSAGNMGSNVKFKKCPTGSLNKKLDWLQCELIKYRSCEINILSAHQDVVAIAAATLSDLSYVNFIHHSDHNLALGVYIRKFKHIDLHPMGFSICRNSLGIENIYLPLTFKLSNNIAKHTHFGCLVTATVAGFVKVEAPYCVSYVNAVPEILRATGGTHIHIGRLTLISIIRIRMLMLKYGIRQRRFKYLRYVESVSAALINSRVDVYVSSFPIAAGLTMIEVMSIGIPIILHNHIYSPILSAKELAYSGAFSWSKISELAEHLGSLTREKLAKEKVAARNFFLQYHQRSILESYFSGESVPCHPNVKFKKISLIDDKVAYMFAASFSCYSIFRKISYRSYLVVRRKLAGLSP